MTFHDVGNLPRRDCSKCFQCSRGTYERHDVDADVLLLVLVAISDASIINRTIEEKCWDENEGVGQVQRTGAHQLEIINLLHPNTNIEKFSCRFWTCEVVD